MKRTYKLLTILLSSLCMLTMVMLPSYAASNTVYYNYPGSISDSRGNRLDGELIISKRDNEFYVAAVTGELNTSNTLPTTHYVYLMAKVRASYTDASGTFYYQAAVQPLGHLTTNRDYFVTSAHPTWGGNTFYFDSNKDVAYIDGWTKLTFTDNDDKYVEVVSGLYYYFRKTPSQVQ